MTHPQTTPIPSAALAHRAAALRASLTHGDPPACLARRHVDALVAWASAPDEVTR